MSVSSCGPCGAIGGVKRGKGTGKKRERCQECKHIITGKGRTLPSTVHVQDRGLRNGGETVRDKKNTAYVKALSPDALIQNYLDSGRHNIMFC